MARKKKTDRPGRVNICFEQLIFDLDFMSNEYAGIILKMIVWYAAGNEEGKKHIEEIEKYIATLPDKGWLTSTYKRLFKAIDDDFDRYEEICEKRRVLALEREERKRNERARENTNVHACAQETTNVHACAQETTTSTNNNNNNNVPKGTDNNINSSSSSSSPNVRVREGGGYYIDSQINFWQNADIVTKKEIPELTEIWIEEIKLLALRFAKQELTDEDVHRHYEDFKAQEVTEILQTTYSDWRKHFGNYVRAALKREKNGNGQKYISRDEQRKQEAAAREQNAANLVKKLLSRNKAAG